jgi:hypothetical protein
MSCLTPDVETWLRYNCLNQASNEAQSFYNTLFENATPTGQLWIPGVNNPTPDQLEFQDLLVDLCNTDPNGKYCREPLLEICSQYTRQDASNPIVRKMCGCYLPNSEYPSADIRTCDTICSGYNTIKYHAVGGEDPVQCISSLCIIDNFTLIAKGSSVGDITFNQTCPNCSAVSNCKCIIGDINIIAQDSRMGALNLNQNCAGNYECYATVEGLRVPVEDCQQYINSFGLTTSVVNRQRDTFTAYVWGFAIFALLLVILFIVGVVLLLKHGNKAEVVQVEVPLTLIKPDKV